MSIYKIRLPLVLRLPQVNHICFFDILLFLYFFTLHADRLGVNIAGFNIRISNILAAFLFLLIFKNKIDWRFIYNKKIFFSFCFLTISFMVSLFFTDYTERVGAFFLMYLFTAVCYGIVPYLIVQKYSVEKVFKCYLCSFLAVGLYSLMQISLSLVDIIDPFITQYIGAKLVRPNAMAYEPSFYALYMTPFIVIVNLIYLIDKEKEIAIFKKMNFGIILFINFLFLLSTTTSAYFSYFVSIFITTLFFPFFHSAKTILLKQIAKFSAILGLGSVVFFCFFQTFSKLFFMKLFFQGSANCSFFQRWYGIKNCWEVFLQNPLFGVGIGGIGHYLHEQWLTGNPMIMIDEDIRLMDSKIAFKAFEPMNVLTEVIAGLGIVGLIAFLIGIIVYIDLAKKILRNQFVANATKKLIFIFLISTLTMIVVLQFNQGLFRTYIWVHFFLTFSYMHKVHRVISENKMLKDSIGIV